MSNTLFINNNPPNSLLMGWTIGQRIVKNRKRQQDVPVKPEEPIAYMYNDMGPLPALPEGYEQCPYATITDMGDGAYDLYLSDVPFFARVNASGTFNLANFYKDTGILFYMFRHVNGIWSVYNPDILGINRVLAFGREKGWANYNMLTEDKKVYIEKTDPKPIYE